MKMFLIVTSIACVTAFGLHAGTAFERVIGGSDLDRGVFVGPTKSGGYVVVGVTKSFGAGGEDVYLVRLDSTGHVHWSRTYGGTASDNGWSVHETADGFAIAGFTESYGAGGFDCYLIKTAADGQLQWSKTYGGEGSDRCWALSRLANGGYLLVGETTSRGAGSEDCFLVGTDASGEELWSRTFGGPESDRCFAISPAGDGGFVLTGQTYSEGAGDRDVFIIKTDPNGKKEWSRTFGGKASDVGHSVVRAADGGFVVFGYTTSFAAGEDDPYLVKVDKNGKEVWTRVLPLEGTNHTLSGDLAPDGGFFLAGFSVFRATGKSAALLVKTSAEGRLEWHEEIRPTTNGESLGYTVRAVSDGGCILTGHTTVESAGDRDLLVVKVAGAAPRAPGGE